MSVAGVLVAVALMASAGDRIAELTEEIGRFRSECAAANRPLGIPDENGAFVLTADGRRLEKLEAELHRLRGETGLASAAALAQGWGDRPLGAPGTLKAPPKTFRRAVRLGKAPVRKPGLVLFGPGVVPTVSVSAGGKGAAELADEFAWHLSQMCGREIGVAKGPSATGPNVVFAAEPGEQEHAGVRCAGGTLLISGVGPGLGIATTYVLEALGVRYLWPGVTGKVIPKKTEIVLPELELDYTPTFVIRGVRESVRPCKPSGPWYGSLQRLGYADPNAFIRQAKPHFIDRPGNRGFWQWHGVNDSDDSIGWDSDGARYRWGHAFEAFADRYKQDHPDWFALQRDGSRVQDRMDRPCFCMSNPGMVAASVTNLLESFARSPKLLAASACLPDGGHTSLCLCENCRKLDPVNAPPLPVSFFRPVAIMPYVSRTDRVFGFFNRLAEGVTAVLPDKKLCVYAYSHYVEPPVKVTPHPALVILAVRGAYTTPRERQLGRENLAQWSSYGNRLLWRPNSLLDHQLQMPRNYARAAFEDLELFKANGIVGTDISASDDSFGLNGLIYYMVAKAHLNPDRLDFDTLYGDYLAAAFGPAAGAMRTWFDRLETFGNEIGDEPIPQKEDVRSRKAAQAKRRQLYAERFDTAAFAKILDEAEKAADGCPDVLRRLGLFRTTLEYAQWQKRTLFFKGDQEARAALKRDFLDFVQATSATPDGVVSVCPVRIGFYNTFLR